VKTKTIVLSVAEAFQANQRPDADLLAYAAMQPPLLSGDVRLLKFNSRAGLEAIAKKSNLRAVIPTQVSFNCAVYRYQSDSEARKERAQNKVIFST